MSRRQLLAGAAGIAAHSLHDERRPRMHGVDYARAARMGCWLHHPSVGDPSWDCFVRSTHNPIHVGREPYWWPVNGTLLLDPVSQRWYAYVSVYPRGYWPPPPADVLLMREEKDGRWHAIGHIFGSSRPSYAVKDGRLGAATDMSVVFHNGAYHALFGWCDPDNKRGGLGYARAEKPEGPFVWTDAPLHDDALQKPILGRYVRAYASTLIRRRRDWLILHMMSTPGNAGGTWGLFGMVSRSVDGPYSAPQPLVLPQTDVYHPSLAEFFPAFVHRGRLYAPATSVAANRSWQALFSASLEQAHLPEAWRLEQEGSMWHNVPDAWEARGIWGQTLACAVTPAGELRAMYPAKSHQDVGAIGIASRPWTTRTRDGFRLSAPNAPAYAILRRHYGRFTLEATVAATGRWRLGWACRGPIGPDHPWADSRPHALMRRERVELCVSDDTWRIVRTGPDSLEAILGAGRRETGGNTFRVYVEQAQTRAVLHLDNVPVWTGDLPAAVGRVELVAEEGSHLTVDRLFLTGAPLPYEEMWLATEAMAGYGVPMGEWTAVQSPWFRYGTGFETDRDGARAKWNVNGSRLELWAPRGPRYGFGRVILDGRASEPMPFHAERDQPSGPVWSQAVATGRHAVILEAVRGVVPCDCLCVGSGES